MTRLRLRQVVLVATDIAAVEREIEEVLGVELAYRDPGVAMFGLVNALYPIGEQLLEIVSPTETGTTAGRFLDRRGGDGGYMVIVQTDEPLDDVRTRLTEHAVRVVFTAEETGVVGLHLHPRDVGGAIVSIDRTDVWEEWPWAGDAWREHVRTGRVTRVRSVVIGALDPGAACARWAAALGRPATDHRIELDDDTEIRFVPAGDRGDGIDAIELGRADGVEPADLQIAGCRVRLS